MCICVTDPLSCTAETNTALEGNYTHPPKKKKREREKKTSFLNQILDNDNGHGEGAGKD